jgi:hypothetical protein
MVFSIFLLHIHDAETTRIDQIKLSIFSPNKTMDLKCGRFYPVQYLIVSRK